MVFIVIIDNIFFLKARPIASTVKNYRLQRDDFETLKVIGRGAFGEVKILYFSIILQDDSRLAV